MQKHQIPFLSQLHIVMQILESPPQSVISSVGSSDSAPCTHNPQGSRRSYDRSSAMVATVADGVKLILSCPAVRARLVSRARRLASCHARQRLSIPTCWETIPFIRRTAYSADVGTGGASGRLPLLFFRPRKK